MKLHEAPGHTQHHLNVHTTSCQRYGRCIDVQTTLCAYGELKGKLEKIRVMSFEYPSRLQLVIA